MMIVFGMRGVSHGAQIVASWIILLLFTGVAHAQSKNACVTPDEYSEINFQLQSPVDGVWSPSAELSMLSIDFSGMVKREVFALGGDFRVERDGRSITPVFICEPGKTHVYDMGEYMVVCPAFDGEPLRIYDDENTFLKSGRLGLARWENDCIRWRTRTFECDPPLKQKPSGWSFSKFLVEDAETRVSAEYEGEFKVLEPHERRVCDTAVVVDQ
jgi:hypothetical protein